MDEAENVWHSVCGKALQGDRTLWPLKMGPDWCPETLGNKLPTYTVLTPQQTSKPQLRHDGSLKSRKPVA